MPLGYELDLSARLEPELVSDPLRNRDLSLAGNVHFVK